MTNPSLLVPLGFDSFKAHLDLIGQTVQGIPPAQFNLNLERQQIAVPLLAPLVSAMIDGQKRIIEWGSLNLEERHDRNKLKTVIKDIETVAKLQGAIAALMAVGDILLNDSMKEQLELNKNPSKSWKPNFKKAAKKSPKKSIKKR